MRILIGGGSGFIGQHLVRQLRRDGHDVTLITRGESVFSGNRLTAVNWDELDRYRELLEGVEVIINLAGASINQRWTKKAKQLILESRLKTVADIAQFVSVLNEKPQVVINSSGMNIYGSSLTQHFDEYSEQRGTDFLAEVVQQWESAVDEIKGPRVVKLRTGLVLGREGGALPRLLLPYKLYAGGSMGSGTQWHSWIHVMPCRFAGNRR